jgi:hypothetical protein
LKKATTQSIKELDVKLSTQMKVLEKDITIKLGSMIVVGVTILGAMIKFF